MCSASRCQSPSCLDEEGRLARVAVRCLHDQVGAQTRVGGELGQLVVAVGPSDDVGHRGCPRLLAEASRHDLGVQVPAQRVRREDQVVAQLLADLLGLLVEEHHRDHRRPARGPHPRRDVGLHLGIAQQVVVDLLAALELDERLVLRGEHPRMGAVPGVVVDEVPEVADPTVDAEQVERGRSHEEDRAGVGPEEAADLGDRPQRSACIGNFSRGVVHDCLLAVSSHNHRRSSMLGERPGRAGLTRAVHPCRPAESRVGKGGRL